MKIGSKDFRLEANGNLDVMGQSSNIPNELRRYDRKIAQSGRLVETLDRYDDFALLRIPSKDYESKGGEYGIERSVIHRGGDVILRHQQEAASRLLRELRGFGMLADVVGSGKTYEAGVVLSELAVRGKMRSLLLIVPEPILDDWQEVLEMRFGLGKGALFRVHDTLFADGLEIEDGIPKRPVIVSTEDFVKWDDAAANVLFDVIVVDEAHRFCSEEGEYARAMRLLSRMMMIKKEAERPYCLLLSATPHSGNLEKMFRLWYFIRCRGGNPDDFEEKDDSARTAEYRAEKEYYKSHVCNGAATVMEFIKRGEVSAVETLSSCRDRFGEFLDKRGIRAKYYGGMTYGEKNAEVKTFMDENEDLRGDIYKFVADAYHDGVLGSIMIRGGENGVSKTKNVVNIFFFPVGGQMPLGGVITVPVGKSRTECSFQFGELYTKGRTFPARLNGGTEELTLDEIAELSVPSSLRGDERAIAVKHERNNMLIRDIFGGAFGAGDGTGDFDPEQFPKHGSLRYYQGLLGNCPPSVENRIYPVFGRKGMSDAQKEDLSFLQKLETAKAIIRSNAGKRIIVFFDYSQKRGSVSERFINEIRKESDIRDRLLVGGSTGLQREFNKVQAEFSAKEDAVLVVTSSALTEGVNLQQCNIILNFQVTPDPVAMDQSIGRVFRIGQKNDVTIYSLADMEKLEGYALAYFSRIGLMSSSGGDATIIAGSNSERMVAVRCSMCGKVSLYSQEEYDKMQKDTDDPQNGLWCTGTAACRAEDPRGTLMAKISIYDFKCDSCSMIMSRSADDEGYICFDEVHQGKLCVFADKDGGDRRYYCNKICAMAHCNRFKPPKGKKCPALELYKKDRTANPTTLAAECAKCNDPDCPPKCRYQDGPEGIAACSVCNESLCSPKPGVYEFDDKWEMRCPKCGGTIRPIEASTFATYIHALWDFRYDDGSTFCKQLSAEADKVAEVKTILDMHGREKQA